MPKILIVLVSAVAFSASASIVAFAANGDGIYQACQNHGYTLHGVWDCR